MSRPWRGRGRLIFLRPFNEHQLSLFLSIGPGRIFISVWPPPHSRPHRRFRRQATFARCLSRQFCCRVRGFAAAYHIARLVRPVAALDDAMLEDFLHRQSPDLSIGEMGVLVAKVKAYSVGSRLRHLPMTLFVRRRLFRAG